MIFSIAAKQMPHAAPAAAIKAVVLFVWGALLSLMINKGPDRAEIHTTLQRQKKKAEDSIALIGPGPKLRRERTLQPINKRHRLFKDEGPDVISTWCENTSR